MIDVEKLSFEKLEKAEWNELSDKILSQLTQQTEKVWSASSPKEFLKELSSEIAEYKFKAEKAKFAGDLESAKTYEDTIKMIFSQVEARAKETEIHIKKGFEDFFKEALKTTLRFVLELIVPLPK